MRVRVVYLGSLREIVGQGSQELELPDRAVAANLWEQLRASYPALQKYERAIAIAVNQEYSKPDRELHDGDEVGFLPPVSGGNIETASSTVELPLVSAHARIQSERIDSNSVAEQLKHGEDGAVSVFDGIVRNNSRGRGRLEIGDTSVLIAVASAHRGAAFDACRFLIDSLKKSVPIWKKEYFEDGAVWADGEPFPPDVKTV